MLYSGVLPFYKYTKNGKGINMSALNGQEGEQYPILIPRLKMLGHQICIMNMKDLLLKLVIIY